MKVLVLCSDNPTPPINGTRIRNYHLWKEVSEQGVEVKLLALTRNPEDLKLSTEHIEFFLFTRKNIFTRLCKRLLHSYHEFPVSESLRMRVEELAETWSPDVIHAEELRMGNYFPEQKSKTKKLSLCVHNVESQLITKTLASPFPFARKLFNRIYRWNLQRFERKIFTRSDIIFTYSDHDRREYKNLYPDTEMETSSNGVNLVTLSPSEILLPAPTNILYFGSLGYYPNMEGLFWFLDKIFTKLRANFDLTVAGSGAPATVRERVREEGVTFIDTPLDLAPVYLQTSLLLVPLLSGSGTRGKILEALMYNRVVLTTKIGVEGLDLVDGEGIIIADDAESFTQALERWLSMSEEERQSIANRGREVVMKKYLWKSVGNHLLQKWKS